MYALAVGVSLWQPPLAALIHVLLAALWLVPNRIERHRGSREPG